MSKANRLVEYFLVIGVDSKANGGQKQKQRDSDAVSTATGSVSAVAEGENGETVRASCW